MLAQESRSGNKTPMPRWLFPMALLAVTIALVGVLVAVAASVGSGGYGWNWMMGGGWGAMWVVGALMMVVPVLLLVLLIALLLQRMAPAPVLVSPLGGADPASTVRMRYARGEITAEQYRKILSDLQQGS